MVRGMYRSRTLRRVKTRVPGGESKLTFKQRKPAQARCAQTGELLHGIPRATPSQTAKLSKTQKRPQRPFGGVLSSRAMRDVIKLEVREEQPSQE